MKVSIKQRNKINRDQKDIDTVLDFTKFCAGKLKINGDINVILVGKGPKDGGGMSTGGYDRETKDILSREFGRSLVDMCRSIAHELVHQRQHELGKFKEGDNIPNIGGEIEDEANALCGQLVKMYVTEKDGRWLYTY
jgi:hypothetical protein